MHLWDGVPGKFLEKNAEMTLSKLHFWGGDHPKSTRKNAANRKQDAGRAGPGRAGPGRSYAYGVLL